MSFDFFFVFFQLNFNFLNRPVQSGQHVSAGAGRDKVIGLFSGDFDLDSRAVYVPHVGYDIDTRRPVVEFWQPGEFLFDGGLNVFGKLSVADGNLRFQGCPRVS